MKTQPNMQSAKPAPPRGGLHMVPKMACYRTAALKAFDFPLLQAE